MDRRALPALLAAATGATLGWAGAALDLPVLAGLSALASMVAGGSALWMLGQLRASERREQRPGRAETVMDGSSWVGIDRETGLPDARFFELCLDNRVSAARRRLSPITVLLLELGAGRGHKVDAGTAMAFALMLRRTLRDADNIARIGPRTFAVILEDTTDNGGVWTADRLLSTIGRDKAALPPIAAAVASYPSHGLRSSELLARAHHALERACVLDVTGPGSVQVAASDATT